MKILEFLTFLVIYLSLSESQDYIGQIPPLCDQPRDPREYHETLVLFMIDRNDTKIMNQNIGYIFKLFLCVFPSHNFFFDVIDYSSKTDWQKPFPAMKKRGRTRAINLFRYYQHYTFSSENITKIDRIYEALEYLDEKREEVNETFVDIVIYIPVLSRVINRSPDWSNFNKLVDIVNKLRNETSRNINYVPLNFFEFDDGDIRFGNLQLGHPDRLPEDVIYQITQIYVKKYMNPIQEYNEIPEKGPYIYPEDRVNPTNNSWKSSFCISIGIGTFLLVIFTIFAYFYIKKLGKNIENRLVAEQGENNKKISEKKSEADKESLGKIKKKTSKTKKIVARKRKTILDVDI